MQQRRKSLRQLLSIKITLLYQFGRTDCNQRLGIARLVVVHRVRVRHQHRAQSGRSKLGKRQRSRATDGKIGPAIAARHVIDKWHNLRLDTGLCISRACLVETSTATLVQHLRPLGRRDLRQRFRHGKIQRACTEAATKYQ